eukprot:TRINITY_DN62995_c0_g1_i1.p1 TRINITY_DN62995_c0_g1~~TRINITY_DN62995_c0_g1_i1.p1  ORF type:complete len:239 (-),score=29.18 TRINITY_DN62995_c0_g1_i1:98-814(-)
MERLAQAFMFEFGFLAYACLIEFLLSVATYIRQLSADVSTAMAVSVEPLSVGGTDVLVEAATEEAEGAMLLARLSAQHLRRQQRLDDAALLLFGCDDRCFYKAVARVGGGLVSVYDGRTEYRIGCLTGSAASDSNQDDTAGGDGGAINCVHSLARPRFFAYATKEEALRCPFPKASRLISGCDRDTTSDRVVAPVVVLKVHGFGDAEYHGLGKFSFSGLLPVAVLAGRKWRAPHRWCG